MAANQDGVVIAKKQLALRDHLWPGEASRLWDRKAHKGFTTIPKTMPLILRIMDEMTKGAPVSTAYLTLWCSTWDNGFVQVIRADDMSFASGFGGQRGAHTWSTRIKKLAALGFIGLKAGKSGPITHAIIYNPHLVIQEHYQKKTPGLTEASFTALVERALEVGALDLFPGSPPTPLTESEAP